MGWVGNIAKSPFKAVAFAWGKSPEGLKTAAGITGALAAGVGILTYDAVSGHERRGKRFDPDTMPVAQIPPMLTPQDLMLQPMPEEISGPAPGRGEYEFRNRVLAGRGQAPEQVAALQPARPLIAPESLQDLNVASKTTQAV